MELEKKFYIDQVNQLKFQLKDLEKRKEAFLDEYDKNRGITVEKAKEILTKQLLYFEEKLNKFNSPKEGGDGTQVIS